MKTTIYLPIEISMDGSDQKAFEKYKNEVIEALSNGQFRFSMGGLGCRYGVKRKISKNLLRKTENIL